MGLSPFLLILLNNYIISYNLNSMSNKCLNIDIII